MSSTAASVNQRNFLANKNSRFTTPSMFQNYNHQYKDLTEFDLECHEIDRYNEVRYRYPSDEHPLYEVRKGTDMYNDMVAAEEDFPLSNDEKSAFQTVPLQRNYAIRTLHKFETTETTESSSANLRQTPPPGYETPDSPPRITKRSLTYPNMVIPGTPVPPLNLDDTRISDEDWMNSTEGNDFVLMSGQRCGNGLPAYMLMHTRMHEPLPCYNKPVLDPVTPRPNRPLNLKDQQVSDLMAANKELRKKLRASDKEQRRLRKKNQDFSRSLREFSVELDIKFDKLDDAEVEDVVFVKEVPSGKRKFNPDFPEEADQEMIEIAKYEEYMAKKRARKAAAATHQL